MGVVVKQSFVNILSIACGVLLGAISTLYLYPNHFGEEYHGLVISILVFSNLIQPCVSFGLQVAIIRYFSLQKTKQEQDRLLWLSVFIPVIIVILVVVSIVANYQDLMTFLSDQNKVLSEYLWIILGIAFANAFFEVQYSWLRIRLKTIFGNFLKELYPRLIIFILLMSFLLTWIDFYQFIWLLFGAYFLRLLLIVGYNLSVYRPVFSFRFPINYEDIFKYSLLTFLSAIAATYILDIDKAQINDILGNKQVAYYAVAIYIAAVIEIPLRSLSQIVSPLVAKAINGKNLKDLRSLLTKSADNQLIVSGFIFALVNVNIDELYAIVNQPGYATAISIVLIVSIGKLFNASMGCINFIISNSKYYRYAFWFSIASAILAVLLNLYLINQYGIIGAAYATLIVIILMNCCKLLLIQVKYRMNPYSKNSIFILLIIATITTSILILGLDAKPIWSLIIQSSIIALLFFVAVLKFKLSEDLMLLYRSWKRKIF